jgi:Ca2+-binding EF-hand superfamily protein
MRKVLFAAAGLAALAGAAGLALAQDEEGPHARHDMLFQADTNNDGVLTRQEFDAGRETMFTRSDVNNDGQLARDEMRGMHGGHHGHRGMHAMHLRGADANHDGAITREEFLAGPIEHFNRLDANHDGAISGAEMPAPRERGEHHGPGGEHPSPDANGDHQLSRAEFAAMGGVMFDRLDANHDGRVTRQEAEAMHARHRE